MNNRTRAEYARAALDGWRSAKGYGPGEEEDGPDARDLITDLLHMLDQDGHNALDVMDVASGAFQHEAWAEDRAHEEGL